MNLSTTNEISVHFEVSFLKGIYLFKIFDKSNWIFIEIKKKLLKFSIGINNIRIVFLKFRELDFDSGSFF